ncbi:MAG: rhomboid family intramembrane serine protease [Acidobacteria bacterium]|nr:rhomboid family intramembrane serine protease [Acidobacteriota bacterium]
MPLPLRWQWKLNRWRERLAALFRPAEKPSRPRLCPACSTLVGATASRCHECGASLNFSLAAATRSLSGLIPSETPVTYFMLGLNVAMFALSLMVTMRFTQGFNLAGGIHPRVLMRLGACLPDIFQTSEYWRLVMPIFLHGNLWHFGFNAFVLLDIGPQVEAEYGSARYLFLYVITGIGAFLVSSWWGNFSIGASGSLMGLVGLMLAITYRRGGNYMRMLRAQLVRWIIYIFIFGLFFRADHAGHLGGLAAGFLLGKIFADREPMNAGERKRAYALGWFAALIILASFGFMLKNYFTAG